MVNDYVNNLPSTLPVPLKGHFDWDVYYHSVSSHRLVDAELQPIDELKLCYLKVPSHFWCREALDQRAKRVIVPTLSEAIFALLTVTEYRQNDAITDKSLLFFHGLVVNCAQTIACTSFFQQARYKVAFDVVRKYILDLGARYQPFMHGDFIDFLRAFREILFCTPISHRKGSTKAIFIWEIFAYDWGKPTNLMSTAAEDQWIVLSSQSTLMNMESMAIWINNYVQELVILERP